MDLERLRGSLQSLDVSVTGTTEVTSLLEAAHRFYATSMSGHYYEAFGVRARTCTEQSKATDAFMAEFDRLIVWCIREAGLGQRPAVREALELLFGLLRQVDQGRNADRQCETESRLSMLGPLNVGGRPKRMMFAQGECEGRGDMGNWRAVG